MSGSFQTFLAFSIHYKEAHDKKAQIELPAQYKRNMIMHCKMKQ
jgi:hypothetical protein